MMRKAVLLGILTLAILSVVAVPTYAYLNSRYSEQTTGPQGFGMKMQALERFRGFRFLRIEVSEESKQRVVDIAKGDPDVQDLVNDGYNVTSAKPVIKAVLQGSGDVTIKASGATVTLTKEKVGLASVEVDLEAGKVTRINVVSRTVIEKSP